jgi:putative tryptophan/tyrosine transport system substrate-binding protein
MVNSISCNLALAGRGRMPFDQLKRRDFITLLGGAAAAWPLAARAQAPDRVRRLGVLMGLASSDVQQRVELTALTQELQKLGWADGRNIRIYYRWGDSDADRTWTSAKELIELQPDVIVAHTTSAVSAFAQQTRTIPIVFVLVSAQTDCTACHPSCPSVQPRDRAGWWVDIPGPN